MQVILTILSSKQILHIFAAFQQTAELVHPETIEEQTEQVRTPLEAVPLAYFPHHS